MGICSFYETPGTRENIIFTVAFIAVLHSRVQETIKRRTF